MVNYRSARIFAHLTPIGWYNPRRVANIPLKIEGDWSQRG
jgi:hypothetical protein